MTGSASTQKAVLRPLEALWAAEALLSDFARFARGRFTGVLLLMFVAGLLEVVSLGLLVPLLAVLTGSGAGRVQHALNWGFAVTTLRTAGSRLAAVLSLFVVANIVRAAVVAWRDRSLFDVELGYLNSRRSRLMRRLGTASWRDLIDLRHVRLIQAVGTEALAVGLSLQMLMSVLVALAMLTFQACMIALLSPHLALLALSIVAVGLAGAAPLLGRAHRLGHTMREGAVELLDTATRLFAGLKPALAEGRASSFAHEFDRIQDRLAAEARRFDRRRARGAAASATVAALALASLVAVGYAEQVSTAALLTVLVIISRMLGPTLGLFRNLRVAIQALPAHAAMLELENALPTSSVGGPGEELPAVGAIKLEKASYIHRGGAGVQNLTLEVASGEVLGVVGPSGAGKTTLIDLLCGLLPPDQGRLCVGGTEINDANVSVWRARVAYLIQDGYLFNGSVRENLGGEAIDEALLWSVLEEVGVSRVVRALPGGLDASVADRGSRLSGGERQRLSLARALLRRPQLLILDEGTSGLDLVTERQVLDRVIANRPDCQIVIVTHRPETLAVCTRVITMREGRITHNG